MINGNECMDWSSQTQIIANKTSRLPDVMNRLKRYLPLSASHKIDPCFFDPLAPLIWKHFNIYIL